MKAPHRLLTTNNVFASIHANPYGEGGEVTVEANRATLEEAIALRDWLDEYIYKEDPFSDDLLAYARMIATQIPCTKDKDGKGCSHCIVEHNVYHALCSTERNAYAQGKGSVVRQVQSVLEGVAGIIR